MRGHVLLCMLISCVERQMRRRLALLLQDCDWAGARAQSETPVEPQVSERAYRKADTKTTEDGLPVHRQLTRIKRAGPRALVEDLKRNESDVSDLDSPRRQDAKLATTRGEPLEELWGVEPSESSPQLVELNGTSQSGDFPKNNGVCFHSPGEILVKLTARHGNLVTKRIPQLIVWS